MGQVNSACAAQEFQHPRARIYTTRSREGSAKEGRFKERELTYPTWTSW